jgi:hypothetical protein
MPDPPRRRRSTPPPSRRNTESSSLLPTVALGVGVVVAGLGIGAFLSAMQHHGAKTTTSSSTAVVSTAPVVTPVVRPTRGQVAVATVVPHPTFSPTPAPTQSATAEPTQTPKATPSPRATPTPRATPSPRATPTAMLKTTPRATVTPHAAPTKSSASEPSVFTPRPVASPTRIPTPHPTPMPTAAAVARATPLTFGGIAQNTVRRYLSDLIAGNENAAYAELGKSPGDGGLSEEAFIDRGTRITSVRTTNSDGNGATVEVGLTSSRGSYYATYHVTNGPNGPVIDQHDYIKV